MYENECLPSVKPEKFISKAELNMMSDKLCSIIYKTLEVQLLKYTYLTQRWNKIANKKLVQLPETFFFLPLT